MGFRATPISKPVPDRGNSKSEGSQNAQFGSICGLFTLLKKRVLGSILFNNDSKNMTLKTHFLRVPDFPICFWAQNTPQNTPFFGGQFTSFIKLKKVDFLGPLFLGVYNFDQFRENFEILVFKSGFIN